MNLNKVISFVVLVILSSSNIFGQQKTISGSSILQTPSEYFLQVKQFGEFIDRFNYKSDWKGRAITEEFKKKVSRASYILTLINNEDDRLINPLDSSYRVLCADFINYVTNPKQPQTIQLFSDQVVAKAKVNITYMGNAKQIGITLIPEVNADRSAKWVIDRVEADCFSSNPDSLQKHFIAPNSHETSFINIKKLNGVDDPIYLFSESMATTNNFLNEIAKKKVIIQNIEKVTYLITFPFWEITVEEFVRSSNNSGWLISNVRKL